MPAIEKRLVAASEGDFVVTFYNPRSRKRVMHLPRALEIMAEHRPPTTPVCVVRDAERPEQSVTVTTLAEFDPDVAAAIDEGKASQDKKEGK